MTKPRKWLCALCVVASVAATLLLQSAFGRKGIHSTFLALKGAIDAKDYKRAYAMTTPEYRDAHSLSDFTAYESWRGAVRHENLKIKAFLGRGSVKADTADSIGWWRLSFEKVDGEWHYCGDRTAYVNFL